MNDARRKNCAKAQALIEDAKSILEEAAQEENDSYDNMPEGLQSGDKGEAVQAAAEALQEAVDQCEQALDSINTATG